MYNFCGALNKNFDVIFINKHMITKYKHTNSLSVSQHNKNLSLFLLNHNNTAPIQQSGDTVYTIMRAKDGHVALEMDKNEVLCNTAL